MTDATPREHDIAALTIWNPWANLIADGYKTIENRSWAPTHTGLLAIHAAANSGAQAQQNHAIHVAARISGLPLDTVERAMEVRGAVVAVARLTGVCSLSLTVPRGEPLACGCGPWAFPGSRHLRLADVRALPDPVPCRGFQKLWQLPDDVYEAILPTAKEVLHG